MQNLCRKLPEQMAKIFPFFRPPACHLSLRKNECSLNIYMGKTDPPSWVCMVIYAAAFSRSSIASIPCLSEAWVLQGTRSPWSYRLEGVGPVSICVLVLASEFQVNLLILQSVLRHQHSPLAAPMKVFIWRVFSWGAFSGNILKDTSWSRISGSYGWLINSPCGLELDTIKLCSSSMRKVYYIKGVLPLWGIGNKIKSIFASTGVLLACLFVCLFFDPKLRVHRDMWCLT